MSFFFSAVYSESLFLALSVGAIYAARRERWALRGRARRARRDDAQRRRLLLVPLLILYLWDAARRAGARAGRCADVLWLALVPLGLAAVLRLPRRSAGYDALAPFHAQEVWFRSFAGPFVGAWDGARRGWQGARQLLSGAREPVYFTRRRRRSVRRRAAQHRAARVARAGARRGVGALRRLPAAYGAYVVAALALPLSYPVGPQPLMSLPRFVAVLFPLAIWLGAVDDRARSGASGSSSARSPRGSPSTGGSSRRGTGSRERGAS